MTSQFIAHMEQILWLYALAYDPGYPVVCLDERPCFLIGDCVEPLAMQTGQVRKEHYAYEKNGSCTLFAAIEPLTGYRLGQVHRQRTRKEFTLFCQALAAAYPQAKKIRLVLDNLNTHNFGSFYAHLPADEAFALAQRFEFWFTPKAASWLNTVCPFGYDRDRVLGPHPFVSPTPHTYVGRIGKRSACPDCPAPRYANQDQLAILHRSLSRKAQ